MKNRGSLKLILLFLGLLGITTAKGQDSIPRMMMTFDQAFDVAKQNSHLIKQTTYLKAEKEQLAKASKGMYLPTVGLTGSYMFLQDDLSLDLTPVRDAITPLYSALGNYGVFSGVPNPDPATNKAVPILPDNLSTQAVRGQLQQGLTQIQNAEWDKLIQKKQFGTIAATAQWPLFAGGKIHAANKAASIEASEVDETMRQKEGELLSELVERYFGLSLAYQAVLVRRDVYTGMQRHLSDAEKMQRDGLIANAEVLQAKLYHAQADRELKKANRTVEVLNNALNNTLALENDTIIEPVTALFYLDSIEPVEYYIKSAETKNPMLQIVESKKQLADINYKVQRADYLPAVAVQGMYDVVNKDLSPYTPDWMVGIGMKWTLFDGTARYRKVRAASAKTSQVEEIQVKAQTDVSTMIFKLYNELSGYREQLSALDTAKAFAEEYLRVREKAFHEEMSNATEVIDARMALAQVRIERLQAIYGYDLALARLLQYAGIPEEFITYKVRKESRTEVYQPMN
ncbi:MAG TPA: TolC family protein [Bacteroidales bacterium]|nr:TolC family protein [Bacteroidales bacterium]